MKKAVFLDRDGVINKERGEYTYRPDDFIINAGLIESIKLLKDNGFIVIIVSNQGGIAKEIYTSEDVIKLYEILQKKLQKDGVEADDFFFCPHHEKTGRCLCRKPGSLLLEKAIALYNIDNKKSFMIGDSERDIIAAERAGVKGVLINANENIYNHCAKIVSF